MVHPYTNQKLETFTISPIVHASKMYPTALSVLTNTCPAANSEHQEHSLFLKSPTDPSVTRLLQPAITEITCKVTKLQLFSF